MKKISGGFPFCNQGEYVLCYTDAPETGCYTVNFNPGGSAPQVCSDYGLFYASPNCYGDEGCGIV